MSFCSRTPPRAAHGVWSVSPRLLWAVIVSQTSLVLNDVGSLRRTAQGFGRRSLSWDFSDVFVVIVLGWWGHFRFLSSWPIFREDLLGASAVLSLPPTGAHGSLTEADSRWAPLSGPFQGRRKCSAVRSSAPSPSSELLASDAKQGSFATLVLPQIRAFVDHSVFFSKSCTAAQWCIYFLKCKHFNLTVFILKVHFVSLPSGKLLP